MQIITLSTRKAFWEKLLQYGDAKKPALAWYNRTLKSDWAIPEDVKKLEKHRYS